MAGRPVPTIGELLHAHRWIAPLLERAAVGPMLRRAAPEEAAALRSALVTIALELVLVDGAEPGAAEDRCAPAPAPPSRGDPSTRPDA